VEGLRSHHITAMSVGIMEKGEKFCRTKHKSGTWILSGLKVLVFHLAVGVCRW